MIKFKYFFDSASGTLNENEVNIWLQENNNITIINISINNGCLGVFYQENLTKEEREKLLRELQGIESIYD
jgi:hypothetical protein